MSNKSPANGAGKWKKKYYEQLDRLDQREHEWKEQAAVLKRAVSRLCIIAEGHDSLLDDYIRNIRHAIRKTVEIDRLDEQLNRMSDRLIRIEEERTVAGRQISTALQRLLRELELPARFVKRKKRLLRRLEAATDEQCGQLLDETEALLQAALAADTVPEPCRQGGWFTRLFRSRASMENTTAADIPAIARLHAAIDWPQDLERQAAAFKERLQHDDAAEAASLLNDFAELINHLRYTSYSAQHTESEIEIQRRLLLAFIDRLDDSVISPAAIAELRSRARTVGDRAGLDALNGALARMLVESRREQTTEVAMPMPAAPELLLQLLEQLVIPPELNDAVEAMKLRLEEEPATQDWQALLKEMAGLLNAFRSHVQEEKQGFEIFLYQVTGRLQELDGFLRQQNSSLSEAENRSKQLDQDLNHQVRDIRDDLSAAYSLDELKLAVDKRLDSMTRFIRDHRSAEEVRFQQAQQSLEEMHARMQTLEQESRQLKSTLEAKDREAQTDTLTRIPNRLAFEQRLTEEIGRRQRFGMPLSLAMLDIDHFKRINDEYGHQAGDKALRTIAQLLLQRIRQTDFLGRYGGEEFVMLLPGSTEQQALMVINELREKIANSGFHYHGLPVTITMSAGVSEFRADEGGDAVLERADRALYTAKHNGRNRCVIAPAG